jgi:hypothetical protein
VNRRCYWCKGLVVRLVSSVAIGTGGVIGLMLGLYVLRHVETQYWPVTYEFRVIEAWDEGPDRVITGTFKKRWDCAFVQPPRTRRTSDNRHFPVVSRSPVAGQSFGASEKPQPFGPWVAQGAAGQRLEWYLIYSCHPLWQSYSYLGVTDP